MRCPFCGHHDTQVVETRDSDEGDSTRRRRKCHGCDKRFTTYERAEIDLPAIVKRDGRREPFNEHKLRGGLARAFEKRAVSIEDIDKVIDVVMTKADSNEIGPKPPTT